MLEAGYVQEATRTLRARRMEVIGFHDFQVNPTSAMVEAGRAAAAPHNPDLIVGLGGGSSMDCAKGINFLLTNGGTMRDYWGYGKASRPMLPMIAVPTTGGTGSEAQSYALISDTETHTKMACGDVKASFASPSSIPSCRIRSHPPSPPPLVTTRFRTRRNAGLDPPQRTLRKFFARSMAARSIAPTSRCSRHPGSLEARGAMLVGAHFAGTRHREFDARRDSRLRESAHRALQHSPWRRDRAVASHVVRWNSPSAGEQYDELRAGDLARRLRELAEAGGLPLSLREASVPEEALPRLA
jgi:alcohol dehydrogenase